MDKFEEIGRRIDAEMAPRIVSPRFFQQARRFCREARGAHVAPNAGFARRSQAMSAGRL
jgi:hypothetical protein